MKTIFLIFISLICIQSITVAQVVGSSPCLTAYPSAPSQVIAASVPVNLIANPAPSGFGYRWYDSDGVTQLSTNQTLGTSVLSATKVYYLAYFHTSTACLTTKVPVRVIWNAEKKTVVKTYASRDSLTTESQLRSGNSGSVARLSQYYDSLGRSNQTVAIQASVGGLDVISFNTYDNYGRELRDYLPFANNSSSPGLYRSNAASLHSTYYTSNFSDSRGFADKTYESSPLSRQTKQGVPGTHWIGKEINLNENTNGSGDAVRIWTVDGAGLPVTSANFPAGALSKFETINENSQKTIEYKDKLGRLILKKVQETSTPAVDHTGWMCTYYVYDSFGRLRVVMPPKATAAILGGQSSTLASIRDGLYYLYTYDERGRMITKKLPDKGTEEMVYDLQDRLVAMRDANLTGQNKWHYIKYEALGRQVMTGLTPNTSNTTTRQGLQNLLNTSYGANNAVINATSGKTGTTNAGGFPNATDGGEGDVMTVNYYDNYSFRKATLTYSKPNSTYHDQSTKVHGLLTGKLVRNLGNSTRYETAIYYDDQGRLIQTFEDHHLGGTMRASTKFDFENRPIETVTALSTPGTQTITKNYHYNNAGLISSITHKINSGAAVTLAQFSYDQLGSLRNKTFPVAGNAAMNFTYNIRGWMKKINDPQVSNGTADIFAQELFYETGSQFNGNISKVEWRGKDDIKRIYNYYYDPANRIKDAVYTVPDHTWQDGRFNIGYVNYDANGNITTLQRVNQQNSSIWALVDNLEYSYQSNSNKLVNVHDYQTSTSYLSKDFKNLGTTNYSYDVNGNLTANSDKDITSIANNHLNLPSTITFSGTNRKIDYWYNAEGVKVRQVNTDGATVKTIDYIGEFVFENSAISYILHEEGRAAFESSAFQYEFFIKDHLGNVRQVVRAPVSGLRIATMEPENAEKEEEEFKNIKESRQGASEHNKLPAAMPRLG
jgi:YD repeat-containing protein